LEFSGGDIAEVNHSTVKTVIIHQSKIDVVKFDGINNFSMWKCEVMDVLNAQNLEDTLLLQEKSADILDKNWNKMNQTACDITRSCLTQDIKYM